MSTSIETRHAWGNTLLRLAVGLIFVLHGAQKLFVMGPSGLAGFFGSVGIPFPILNAYTVIVIELLGGIAMIAGLGTRFIARLFAIVMIVAIATVHGPQGFFLPNGYEYTLLVLVASVALALQGAGAYALDNVLAGRRIGARQVAAVKV